jgi:hypothetical protein
MPLIGQGRRDPPPSRPTQSGRITLPPLSRFTARFAAYQRSRKGNLWCRRGELTLTVFRRDADRYLWCIHDGHLPRFSRVTYRSEGEALEALENALEAGSW